MKQVLDPTQTGLLEAAPLSVLPEWCDANGHMSNVNFVQAFDRAKELPFAALGLHWVDMQLSGGTTFMLESRTRFFRELLAGDPLRLNIQILDLDEKRIHLLTRMYHGAEGYLAATFEELLIHADVKTRRSAPFPPDRFARLHKVFVSHRELPRPPEIDRPIAIRRRG